MGMLARAVFMMVTTIFLTISSICGRTSTNVSMPLLACTSELTRSAAAFQSGHGSQKASQYGALSLEASL